MSHSLDSQNSQEPEASSKSPTWMEALGTGATHTAFHRPLFTGSRTGNTAAETANGNCTGNHQHTCQFDWLCHNANPYLSPFREHVNILIVHEGCRSWGPETKPGHMKRKSSNVSSLSCANISQNAKRKYTPAPTSCSLLTQTQIALLFWQLTFLFLSASLVHYMPCVFSFPCCFSFLIFDITTKPWTLSSFSWSSRSLPLGSHSWDPNPF